MLTMALASAWWAPASVGAASAYFRADASASSYSRSCVWTHINWPWTKLAVGLSSSALLYAVAAPLKSRAPNSMFPSCTWAWKSSGANSATFLMSAEYFSKF